MGFDLMDEDKLKEECGVMGVYSKGQNVSHMIYYGLYALQHRGQESAGIAVSKDSKIDCYKDMGLVSQVFSDKNKLERLEGNIGVGHVRYSTTGES